MLVVRLAFILAQFVHLLLGTGDLFLQLLFSFSGSLSSLNLLLFLLALLDLTQVLLDTLFHLEGPLSQHFDYLRQINRLFFQQQLSQPLHVVFLAFKQCKTLIVALFSDFLDFFIDQLSRALRVRKHSRALALTVGDQTQAVRHSVGVHDTFHYLSDLLNVIAGAGRHFPEENLLGDSAA